VRNYRHWQSHHVIQANSESPAKRAEVKNGREEDPNIKDQKA
jgi:hypothetical protein